MKYLFVCLTNNLDFANLAEESVKRVYNTELYFLDGNLTGKFLDKPNVLFSFDELSIEEKVLLIRLLPCIIRFISFKYIPKSFAEKFDRIILMDDDFVFLKPILFKESLGAAIEPFSRNVYYKTLFPNYYRTFNGGCTYFEPYLLYKFIDFLWRKIISNETLIYTSNDFKFLRNVEQWSISDFFAYHNAEDLSDRIGLALNDFSEHYAEFLYKKYSAIHYIKDKKKWFSFLKEKIFS